MPISAAGNRSRRAPAGAEPFRRAENARQGGFTLIELMVVMTIIGLASTAAVLAIPDPRGRVLDEGLRFAARARAARDAAIVEARPVSLWVTSGGYGFDRRIAGHWSPVADKPLRVERWNEGTRATLPDPSGRVRVTFDPTGAADRGVDVTLVRDDVRALVRVGADGEVRADAQ